jgi:hypothetical protein
LVKGIQGLPQIFVGGGFSKGIEIWDPVTGETALFSEFIPPESDRDSVALNSAQIVPFNLNKNLMVRRVENILCFAVELLRFLFSFTEEILAANDVTKSGNFLQQPEIGNLLAT